jgi:hypothetical protein
VSTGGVVVEDLLSPATLARFNAELDPLLARVSPHYTFLNPALDWFFGHRTRHITAVASKSRAFVDDVLMHPTLLAVRADHRYGAPHAPVAQVD